MCCHLSTLIVTVSGISVMQRQRNITLSVLHKFLLIILLTEPAPPGNTEQVEGQMTSLKIYGTLLL